MLAAGLILAQALPFTPAPVGAQPSLPPFPYVLQGTVTLDGAPLAGSATLTAAVGDWTSRPVDVIDGRFGVAPSQPLIVGPPSPAYVGETVTFHLRGLTADLTFTFETLPAPEFVEAELRFVSGASAATPTPQPTPTPSPTAAPRATPTPTPEPSPEGGPGAGVIAGAGIGGVLLLSLALLSLARRLGR